MYVCASDNFEKAIFVQEALKISKNKAFSSQGSSEDAIKKIRAFLNDDKNLSSLRELLSYETHFIKHIKQFFQKRRANNGVHMYVVYKLIMALTDFLVSRPGNKYLLRYTLKNRRQSGLGSELSTVLPDKDDYVDALFQWEKMTRKPEDVIRAVNVFMLQASSLILQRLKRSAKSDVVMQTIKSILDDEIWNVISYDDLHTWYEGGHGIKGMRDRVVDRYNTIDVSKRDELAKKYYIGGHLYYALIPEDKRPESLLKLLPEVVVNHLQNNKDGLAFMQGVDTFFLNAPSLDNDTQRSQTMFIVEAGILSAVLVYAVHRSKLVHRYLSKKGGWWPLGQPLEQKPLFPEPDNSYVLPDKNDMVSLPEKREKYSVYMG